jgi:hypothetical protein
MRERLIEDWLTRINERGYEVAFCQTLIAKRFKILRCGHSPTEHGKDVIALAPDGTVWAYQLKAGDIGQSELLKHQSQLNMLVETRPRFPGLPERFDYRPVLVTTGEFKQPALSLISELNVGWCVRNHPKLEVINGRTLQVEFLQLLTDFWPRKPPDLRKFRELYLSTGKGDLDLPQLSSFLHSLLQETDENLEFARQISAVGIFCSYLLAEFFNQDDHWSVFQGQVLCASIIAWAGQTSTELNAWIDSYFVARESALAALKRLAAETMTEGALDVRDIEIDEFTRTRNTIALSATICAGIIGSVEDGDPSLEEKAFEQLSRIFPQRVIIWGESAFVHFLMFFWVYERAGRVSDSLTQLIAWIKLISERNNQRSEIPLADPYSSADDSLTEIFERMDDEREISRASFSYSLTPAVLLAVRRGQRARITEVWDSISNVTLKWLLIENPRDVLLWHTTEAEEITQMFCRPQSWRDLVETAVDDQADRIPPILRTDIPFALMFLLIFPHRAFASIIKHLDNELSPFFARGG